jgi:predicted PurR-regulated permease PerM
MKTEINTLWWIAGLLICGFIYLLSPILSPFLLAAILAYIANPLVCKLSAFDLKGWRLSRSLATVIVMLLILFVLLLIVLIVVPMLQKQFLYLVQKSPIYMANLKQKLEPWMMQYFGMALDFDISQVQKVVTDHWQTAGNIAKQLTLALSSQGIALVGLVANLLLLPIVLFYLLLDWHVLLAKVQILVPKPYLNKTNAIAKEIDDILGEFLRGQLTVMLAMGVFYALGLWLAGLEFAVPIGLLSGLLGFVPYVGIGLGFILALLSGLLQFGDIAQLIPIFAVFGIGQLLESMLLTPWLVGDRIGLHPLVVIFALMAGGQLFGFIGILLALPASAAMAVGFNHATQRYLTSQFYNGQ